VLASFLFSPNVHIAANVDSLTEIMSLPIIESLNGLGISSESFHHLSLGLYDVAKNVAHLTVAYSVTKP
jgi:hypothetical protein